MDKGIIRPKLPRFACHSIQVSGFLFWLLSVMTSLLSGAEDTE